eukprot:9477487-Pyramimonas_sp.AAC.1
MLRCRAAARSKNIKLISGIVSFRSCPCICIGRRPLRAPPRRWPDISSLADYAKRSPRRPRSGCPRSTYSCDAKSS